MGKWETLEASRELVVYIDKFTKVMELQMDAICTEFNQTMDDILKLAFILQESTKEKKDQADVLLHETYLNPDTGTQELMDSIQKSVDDVFEQAKSKEDGQPGEDSNESAADAKLRRFGGKFSKNIEALATMDDAMKEMVMQIVGNLSNEDVIFQIMSHVKKSITALQLGVNYVLIDFKGRFGPEAVERIRADLLLYTYKQYTCASERKLFESIFEPPKGYDAAG